MSACRPSLNSNVARFEADRADRIELRKNSGFHICISGKPSVECDQFAVGRPTKSGQESVVPDFGRKGLVLCVASSYRLDAGRFPDETDTRIAEHRVVHLPGLQQSHCCRVNDLWIRHQSQAALLRHSAEKALIARSAVEPTLRSGVVDVRIDGQGQPKVNVRKKHRLLPKSP